METELNIRILMQLHIIRTFNNKKAAKAYTLIRLESIMHIKADSLIKKMGEGGKPASINIIKIKLIQLDIFKLNLFKV